MLATFQLLMAGHTNDEIVEVEVDNQIVETFNQIGGTADAREFERYYFDTPNNDPVNIKIHFVNDGIVNGQDRAVRVHSIARDGERQRANDLDVYFGALEESAGCQSGFNGNQLMACNGYLEFRQAEATPIDGPVAATPIDGLAADSTITHHWKQLNFATITDPVIIAGPPTSADSSPGVVQVRNVSQSSAQLRFKEWTYQDFNHGEEVVSWLAVGEGRYTTADGSTWEVGKFDLSGISKWGNVRFQSSFTDTPNLFLTVQTQNGSPVLVRADNVTAKSFDAALFEEQALLLSGHGTETIGYLAIEPAAASGAVNIGGADIPYLFDQQLVGTDPKDIAGFSVQLEEEQSEDAETGHSVERVNGLALGGQYFAQIVEGKGLDPVVLRQAGIPPAFSLPNGFVLDEVALNDDFHQALGVEIDSLGRQFLADNQGLVWEIVNGEKRATPFLDIRNVVSNVNFGSGQMTGFKLDPNFVNNGHVYALYTTTVGGESFGRLTRYTRSTSNPDVIDQSTARHLIGKTAATGLIAADFHSLGDIEFGEDGTLLFSWGDSASNDANDPSHYNSQDLDIAAGKIFRINAATGRGFATNPFFDGNFDSIRSKVWAYGVRNGFRFTVQPSTGTNDLRFGNPGRILIGDVGRDRFDELNLVERGDNLGWPYFEGTAPFRDGGQGETLVEPLIAFAHPDARSVTGGVFIQGNNYPVEYQGKYLIADFVVGWIQAIEVNDDGTAESSSFATGIKGIADMFYDPFSGDIFIAGQGRGTIFGANEGLDGLYRLRYVGV